MHTKLEMEELAHSYPCDWHQLPWRLEVIGCAQDADDGEGEPRPPSVLHFLLSKSSFTALGVSDVGLTCPLSRQETFPNLQWNDFMIISPELFSIFFLNKTSKEWNLRHCSYCCRHLGIADDRRLVPAFCSLHKPSAARAVWVL